MKFQYNLRVALMAQWASSIIGFFTICFIFRILLPCWRYIKKVFGDKTTFDPYTAHLPQPQKTKSTVK